MPARNGGGNSKEPQGGATHQSAQGKYVAAAQGGGDATIDASTHHHYHGAPRPSGPPLHRLPRVEGFLGRDAELARVLEHLAPGTAVTLCGSGGMGKSALVAEVLHALAPGDEPPEAFPGGVLLHTFYDQPRVDVALESFALALGDESKPDPMSAARRALAGKRVLLVLDGAERADDLPRLLSVAEGCGVVITTREHKDARGELLDLDPLASEDAMALLRAAVRREIDDTTAREICDLVGDLPLAVFLAGSFVASHGVAPEEYLEWLKETPLEALDHGTRRYESVRVLMERSVEELSDDACSALAVAGLLAMAPFEREFLLAAWGEERPLRATKALGELANLALLRREGELWRTTHALVHTYASSGSARVARSAARAKRGAARVRTRSQGSVPGSRPRRRRTWRRSAGSGSRSTCPTHSRCFAAGWREGSIQACSSSPGRG